MRDEIVRGLMVRWLHPEQRTQMWTMESALPPDRSWKGSEILSCLNIQKTGYTPDPAELAEMERCWIEFYKTVLGPLHSKEDRYHPEKCCVDTEKEHFCSMAYCHHERDPRLTSEAKKMRLWDEFAIRHYKAPALGGSIEASLKF